MCIVFVLDMQIILPLMPNDIILNSLVQYINLSSCYFLSSGSNFLGKSSHMSVDFISRLREPVQSNSVFES